MLISIYEINKMKLYKIKNINNNNKLMQKFIIFNI